VTVALGNADLKAFTAALSKFSRQEKPK